MSLRREHDRTHASAGCSASDAMTHRIRGYAAYQFSAALSHIIKKSGFQPQ